MGAAPRTAHASCGKDTHKGTGCQWIGQIVLVFYKQWSCRGCTPSSLLALREWMVAVAVVRHIRGDGQDTAFTSAATAAQAKYSSLGHSAPVLANQSGAAAAQNPSNNRKPRWPSNVDRTTC